MRRTLFIRMAVGLLLAASLTGNVWLATKVRSQRAAAQYAFDESAWPVSVGMGIAFASLGEGNDWVVPLQQTQAVKEQVEAAARLRPFLNGERRLVAEQYRDLRTKLLEFNHIIGRLAAGDDSSHALLAVRNWVAIYNQIDWPANATPEVYWADLHRSLEQLLTATDDLKRKCMSVPGSAGLFLNDPTYRYACE